MEPEVLSRSAKIPQRLIEFGGFQLDVLQTFTHFGWIEGLLALGGLGVLILRQRREPNQA